MGRSVHLPASTMPTALRATRAVLEGREVVVFTFPVQRLSQREALLAALTAAEREVVLLVLEGHGNARVAQLRGTSVRTVGKQIESAYRRLGVRSRGELAALLA